MRYNLHLNTTLTVSPGQDESCRARQKQTVLLLKAWSWCIYRPASAGWPHADPMCDMQKKKFRHSQAISAQPPNHHIPAAMCQSQRPCPLLQHYTGSTSLSRHSLHVHATLHGAQGHASHVCLSAKCGQAVGGLPGSWPGNTCEQQHQESSGI